MDNKTNLHTLLKPKKIDDIIGQKHLLNENGIIKKIVKNRYLCSLIFYGPPGVGKSSLAMCIINELNIHYGIFNASIDNKEKLMNLLNQAKKYNYEYIIVIEEIHRLNKDKQDIFLPLIEHEHIHLILITTENPFFIINPALRSRAQILQLNPLSKLEIYDGIKKYIESKKILINISDENIKKIINQTNGDFRSVINILDLLINLYKNQEINDEILKNVLLQNYILGCNYGDEIHDLKSAFHKSIRGSDPQAAVYYLHRLINIGDMDSIYRRLLVICYEDIGLANPNLSLRVKNAIEVAKYLGLPEAKLALTQITLELAMSPKSNSIYKTIENVENDILNGEIYSIPIYLKDSHYKSAYKLGIKGYKYPHNYVGNYVEQNYLPIELKEKQYFIPNDNYNEQKIYHNYLAFIQNAIKNQK